MAPIVNKQVRGFAVVWTMITIVIGTATFFGIYLTYGGTAQADDSPGENSVTLPDPSEEPTQQVAAVSTNPPPTPVPTRAIPTNAPTDTPTEVADIGTGAGSPDSDESTAQDAEPSATVPPTATPLPVSDDSFDLGIQVQFSISFDENIQRTWMNDVEALGLDWMKQQVRWEDIEVAPGEYDWGKLDLALPIAAEYGIKVLASVVTAPEWARIEGAPADTEGPPADPQLYADFLQAMLERYPGQIHAIEVWNEQNLDREWYTADGFTGQDVTDYLSLLRLSYQTIKDVDPGVIVISGALAPTGGFALPDGKVTAVDDFDFLDQMIEGGLLDMTDCVGAHHNGYNINPSVTWDNVPDDPDAVFRGPFDNPHHSWSFRSTLQTYANKIALAGGDQKLCVTEFGWASTEDLEGYPVGFEFSLDNTLEEQAEWTIDAINNMREWDIVWLAIIWNLNYGPQAGWSTESDNTPYSLIGPDWVRRPAYNAVAEWSRENPEE